MTRHDGRATTGEYEFRANHTTPAGPDREQAAHRLLLGLRQRAALGEGVGILRVWQLCEASEARDELLAAHGQHAQNTEARRMIGVVNAVADGRADPDPTRD